MSQEVLIFQGLPGSGKTYAAKELLAKYIDKYKRINKDDLRSMLDNSRHSKPNERFILTVRNFLLSMSLIEGKSVIIDDTNLAPIHINTIKGIVQTFNREHEKLVSVKVKFQDVPLDLCIERDANRQNSVGSDVIKSMYGQYLYAKNWKIITKNEFVNSSKPVYVFDMDGTLANIDHRLHFVRSKSKKWDYFSNHMVFDSVKDEIKQKAVECSHYGFVVIVSARTESHRAQTEKWMTCNNIPFNALLMRENGDFKDDAIVKCEIIDKYLSGVSIKEWVDDRPKVIEAVRSKGINVIDVGQGIDF